MLKKLILDQIIGQIFKTLIKIVKGENKWLATAAVVGLLALAAFGFLSEKQKDVLEDVAKVQIEHVIEND